MKIRELQVTTLLNGVVFAAIAAVAYADWLVVAPISLGYLYMLPISLSALVNPLPLSVGLAAGCTVLADAFGPPAHSLTLRLTENLIYLAGFLAAGFVVTLIARERNRLDLAVRRQRDEYEHDLALAAHVQRQVLPAPPVLPGFDFAAAMRTARLLGGDYYDFFAPSKGVVDVVIADVSGKGAAAALLMPSLAVALRLNSHGEGGPAAIVKEFDRVLKQVTDAATFVTMFYARIRCAERTLEYANAGHNPPVIVRAQGELLLLDQAGPILGILPGAQYRNVSVPLEHGDILALFTDGVTEQEDRSGEQFSLERLTRLLEQRRTASASDLVAEVTETVRTHAGTDELADDLTVVIAKVE
jgi:serine phosphatase RsbU (regulator of sigma subunit)